MKPQRLDALPERLDALVNWFETLSPATVGRTADWYAADARFTDPFNDVTGAAAIERIYAHLFKQADEPRFRVTARYPGSPDPEGIEASRAMLTWTFSFRTAEGSLIDVPGASELHFAADGRITRHIDHWDPSLAIYGRVPLLGTLLRWVRRRIAAA